MLNGKQVIASYSWICVAFFVLATASNI